MQPAKSNLYAFFSCTNRACGFRFPSPPSHPYAQHCPRCGALVKRVAERVSGQQTAVSPPARPLSALLDNIRSLHNVGSIFRTADGANIQHLYLCGITSTPANPKLAKAALGAEKTVRWSAHNNAVETAVFLKQQGHALWALEMTSSATPLFTQPPPPSSQPIILIVGNEKAGIDPGLLQHCDQTLYLPMLGQKESLNVAVAFGIAAYQLTFASHTK